MYASSMISLFGLADEIHKVKGETKAKLFMYEVVIIPKNKSKFEGWDQETISLMFFPLQSGSGVTLKVEENF